MERFYGLQRSFMRYREVFVEKTEVLWNKEKFLWDRAKIQSSFSRALTINFGSSNSEMFSGRPTVGRSSLIQLNAVIASQYEK